MKIAKEKLYNLEDDTEQKKKKTKKLYGHVYKLLTSQILHN